MKQQESCAILQVKKLLPVESTIIKHNTSKLKRKQSKFGLPVALSP